MDGIRILIVDDMKEIRMHLAEEIGEKAERIEVVGTASCGQEAVSLVPELLPDVVLMDIQMETRTAGISAIQKIHGDFPNIKCIALTIHEDEEFIFRAYLAGAVDYIIKTQPIEKIIQSIEAVVENRLLLRPEVGKKLIDVYQQIQEKQVRMKETMQVMLRINTTEYDILKLACQGMTYRQIAQQRFVEETTIRSQVNHILKKFNKKKMKDVIAQLRELDIFD